MRSLINKNLSCFHLKIFAAICMIVDHIAVVFLWPSLQLYTILRSIGRMALPIYAFLVVESCNHTKSMEKYFLRLGLFALISEIPFDLAFFNSDKIDFFANVNIFYTFFFAVTCIYIFETMRNQSKKIQIIAICLLAAFVGIMCFLMRVTGEKLVFESMLFVYLGGLLVACHSFCKNGGEGQTSKTFFGNIISILLIFPIIFLGEIINCDYDTFGIILIVCAYMIKYICPKRLLQILILGTGMIYFYGIEPWSRWIRWGHIFGVREIMYLCFSLVAVVILFWYNGERGKNFKWTFYWIYPIHIFILYVLNTFLTLA